MSFLLLLFILAIFIIVLIPTIIFSIIRTILSVLGFTLRGRKRGGASSYGGYSRGADGAESGDSSRTNYRTGGNDASRKKMFDKNEGEYVDFEEIKDE